MYCICIHFIGRKRSQALDDSSDLIEARVVHDRSGQGLVSKLLSAKKSKTLSNQGQVGGGGGWDDRHTGLTSRHFCQKSVSSAKVYLLCIVVYSDL